MNTQAYQILNTVALSDQALSAKEIADKVSIHPATVRVTLAGMYRRGMVQRREAKMPSDYKGKIPYNYFVEPKDTPSQRKNSDVKIVAGDRTMSVTEARDFYSQLKKLFG